MAPTAATATTTTKSAADRVHNAHKQLERILKARTIAKRNKLLNKAPLRVIKHICNLCNVAVRHVGENGAAPEYDAKQLRKLQPYADDLRTLIKKSPSLKSKRRVLQKGGFFPLLAKLLIPAVGGLIGAIANRNNG